MAEYMVVAVDFDGVIHDFKHPVEGRRMCPPIAVARQALEKLRELGFQIVVFTVWGNDKGIRTIEDYMIFYQLPFDEVTNVKPNADYYIDDKAIKFIDWNSTLQGIEEGSNNVGL